MNGKTRATLNAENGRRKDMVVGELYYLFLARPGHYSAYGLWTNLNNNFYDILHEVRRTFGEIMR